MRRRLSDKHLVRAFASLPDHSPVSASVGQDPDKITHDKPKRVYEQTVRVCALQSEIRTHQNLRSLIETIDKQFAGKDVVIEYK